MDEEYARMLRERPALIELLVEADKLSASNLEAVIQYVQDTSGGHSNVENRSTDY